MANEVLEFTLEVNGVQQTVDSVEELQGAIKDLQTQISSGNYGADKLKQLQTELDKATKKLQEMEAAAKKSGKKTEESADLAKKGLGALRESFDGAANAAELFAGENETLGKITQTVMKAIGVANSAREISENRLTLATIRKTVAEKAAAAGTAVLNVVNKALNTTLRANPVGLIVTAVALLIAGFIALIGPIKKLIAQFDFLKTAIDFVVDGIRNVLSFLSGGLIDDASTAKTKANAEKVLESYDDIESAANQNINTIKNRIRLLEAEGASEQTLFNEKIKLIQAEIKKREDAVKAIITLGDDATEEQKKQLASLRKEITDFGTDVTVETLKFKKAQEAQAKSAADKAKAEAEKIAAANKSAGQKLLEIQQQNTLALIKDEEQRLAKTAEFANQKAVQEIRDLKKQGVNRATIQALLLEQDKKYQAELSKIQEDGLKKREDQQKAYDSALLNLQNQYTLLTVQNAQDRANQELEIAQSEAIKAIEVAQYTEEQKQALILQTQELYKEKQRKLDEDFAMQQRDREIARFQEDLANNDSFNMLRLSQQQALFDKQRLEYEKLVLAEAEGSERRKKLEADYENFVNSTTNNIAANRAAALDAVQAAIQNVASIVGQNTVAGKALAVADAVINTYKGASQALGSAPPPFNFILAASVVAAGLANVRKITQTQVPAGGAAAPGQSGERPQSASKFARGGLLTGPTHASGGIKTNFGELEGGEYVVNRKSTAMYSGVISAINQIGGGRKYADGGMIGMETMNQLNDLEKKLSSPPPIKTYVVASDVSSAQEADFKINNLSRL